MTKPPATLRQRLFAPHLRSRFPVAATIGAGLLAPLRHPIALLLCSLPWLIVTVALNLDLAKHRSFTPFLGVCCAGWHYEASSGLYVLQALALLVFAVSWMHVTATGRTWLQRLARVWSAERITGLAIALAAAMLLLIAVAVLFFALGYSLHAAAPDWWWFGGGIVTFQIAFGAACAWLIGRLAPYLPAAITDPPNGLAAVWAWTRGQALWVFLTVATAPLIVAAVKAALLLHLADRELMRFPTLILDLPPLWTYPAELDPVPGWLLALSIALAWLQLSWLFATLSLLTRSLAAQAARPGESD